MVFYFGDPICQHKYEHNTNVDIPSLGYCVFISQEDFPRD